MGWESPETGLASPVTHLVLQGPIWTALVPLVEEFCNLMMMNLGVPSPGL